MMREVDGHKSWPQQFKDGLLPQLVAELAPQPMRHGFVHLSVVDKVDPLMKALKWSIIDIQCQW